MTLPEVFLKAVSSAHAQRLNILQVRISRNAALGEITTAPISSAPTRRAPLEIVVHPSDWTELLKSQQLWEGAFKVGEPDRICGLPVIRHE